MVEVEMIPRKGIVNPSAVANVRGAGRAADGDLVFARDNML
jgi:hypothetical protein